MNTETKIPELICDGRELTNWDEVENWLELNCPAYDKAQREGIRSQLGEISKLRIAIFLLAQQNQSMIQSEIKRSSGACVTYPVSNPILTAEEFYIERDSFMRYVAFKVNPERLKAGLSVISDSSASRCFDIIINRTYLKS